MSDTKWVISQKTNEPVLHEREDHTFPWQPVGTLTAAEAGSTTEDPSGGSGCIGPHCGNRN